MAVKADTIIPAHKTPSIIEGKAYFGFMLNNKAMTEPVHAPVTGKGIATKIANPIAPYFITCSPFL